METAERLMLYQTAHQDTQNLKANQWRFSHYGLLIQAALVAASAALNTPGWLPIDAWKLLGFFSAGTFVAAVCLIHEAQVQIVEWRRYIGTLGVPIDETMTKWREKHGPKRTKCLSISQKHWGCWTEDWPFARLFFFLQFLAAGLAIWVIWSGSSPRAC